MVGRPRIFESAEELQKAVDDYFTFIKGEKNPDFDPGKNDLWIREPEPATITGLALYIGFESRQSVYDYENNGKFSYTIKTARLRVENEYEKKLHGSIAAAGPIFALKNMGWKDRTETDLNHSGSTNDNLTIRIVRGNTKPESAAPDAGEGIE